MERSRPNSPNGVAPFSAQRDAMKPLAYMDGLLRGPAWAILPSGVKHTY
jgi:hypothetical protein